MSSATPSRLPAIDAVKAFASQFIVLHHLAYYGPMTDTVYPAAGHVVRWLRDFALLGVPAFLVMGGFFAARALLPSLAQLRLRSVPGLLWKRYTRLMRPYVVALICAIACAALARALLPHEDIPAAPTVYQVLAHLFLLQDILEIDALSAGVWYIAIDFQLFALLMVLVIATTPLRRATPQDPAAPVLLACGFLIVMALTWINRNPELEMWAPYFFGAYGLGILADRMVTRPRGLALGLVAGLTILALVIEWRSRVLVAGLTAALLILSRGGRLAPAWTGHPVVAFLGRISFSLFLIHYPVCMVVGSFVGRLWPTNVAMNVAGMLAAWLLSIGAAVLLYRWVENPPRTRMPAVAAPSHA